MEDALERWALCTAPLPVVVTAQPTQHSGDHLSVVEAIVARGCRQLVVPPTPAFPETLYTALVHRWLRMQPRGRVLLLSDRHTSPPSSLDLAVDRCLTLTLHHSIRLSAELTAYVTRLEQAQTPVLVLLDEAHLLQRPQSRLAHAVLPLLQLAHGAVAWTPWPLLRGVHLLELLVAPLAHRTARRCNTWTVAQPDEYTPWLWWPPVTKDQSNTDTETCWLPGLSAAAWSQHKQLVRTHAKSLRAVATGHRARLGDRTQTLEFYRALNAATVNAAGVHLKSIWLEALLSRLSTGTERLVIAAYDPEAIVPFLQTWNRMQPPHRRRRIFCPFRTTSAQSKRRGLVRFNQLLPGTPNAVDTLLLDVVRDSELVLDVPVHTLVLWELTWGPGQEYVTMWRQRCRAQYVAELAVASPPGSSSQSHDEWLVEQRQRTDDALAQTRKALMTNQLLSLSPSTALMWPHGLKSRREALAHVLLQAFAVTLNKNK